MIQLNQFVYLSHVGEVDSCLHHQLTHQLLHTQFKNSTNSLAGADPGFLKGGVTRQWLYINYIIYYCNYSHYYILNKVHCSLLKAIGA